MSDVEIGFDGTVTEPLPLSNLPDVNGSRFCHELMGRHSVKIDNHKTDMSNASASLERAGLRI
jgi:hypothetical protein